MPNIVRLSLLANRPGSLLTHSRKCGFSRLETRLWFASLPAVQGSLRHTFQTCASIYPHNDCNLWVIRRNSGTVPMSAVVTVHYPLSSALVVRAHSTSSSAVSSRTKRKSLHSPLTLCIVNVVRMHIRRTRKAHSRF
jgi:hypothetical protein